MTYYRVESLSKSKFQRLWKKTRFDILFQILEKKTFFIKQQYFQVSIHGAWCFLAVIKYKKMLILGI